ncbi:MAG: putative ABC transporter permease [Bacilli bacterium]|nr:putative ABC transporter permease [Bacilli bacterium]
MNYLNIFFFFSIVGHFIESILVKNYKSGILYGYWTPIYGLGILIILSLNNALKKRITEKWKRYIALFFASAVTLAVIEYIGGYLIQKFFHQIFWNYTNHKGNIGLYTSIEMSFLWGICSILVATIIEPLCQKYSNKIPKWISYLLLGIFIIDCIMTISNNLISF